MTPHDIAVHNLIWAILYIVLFYYLRKPIITFFKATHPIRILYHFILPMLLGFNMGDALSNYLLLN